MMCHFLRIDLSTCFLLGLQDVHNMRLKPYGY